MKDRKIYLGEIVANMRQNMMEKTKDMSPALDRGTTLSVLAKLLREDKFDIYITSDSVEDAVSGDTIMISHLMMFKTVMGKLPSFGKYELQHVIVYNFLKAMEAHPMLNTVTESAIIRRYLLSPVMAGADKSAGPEFKIIQEGNCFRIRKK